jgi:hypothetical protein
VPPSSGPPPETARRFVAAIVGPGAPAAVSNELAAWVGGSNHMRRFVDANGAKVRRKLREARDVDAQRDVRAELLVAACLLADRRFELAYEAAGASRAGPDFVVTFRGVSRFNVEVTRRRGAADAAAIADAVLAKLRQLPPSVPNVLVVAVERQIDPEEVRAAMAALRARADARDAAVLARAGAAHPKAFYERFLRLAAIVAWAESAPQPEERAATWLNPSARIALDRAAIAAVTRALAA